MQIETGDWAKEQITVLHASSLYAMCGGKAYLSDYKELGKAKLDRRRAGGKKNKTSKPSR